jgi:holo-[acyl-carrier protein] synthase
VDLIGLGTQIIECPRVRKLIDAHGETFLRSVYTDRELAFCKDRTHSTEFYAAVWAAKEAVFRSLGTKWRRGVAWQEVEIVCDSVVNPTAELAGGTRSRRDDLGVTVLRVTFAYTRLFATATALALK